MTLRKLRLIFSSLALACAACVDGARLPQGAHVTGLVADEARIRSRAANERAYSPLPAGLEVERGVVYNPQYPSECQLDVFRSSATPPPRPVIVKFHGGGLEGGDKSWHPQVLHSLAGNGFLVITVNYRQYPEYRWPAMLEDGLEAMRWVGKHATAYGGDPARLGVLGDSAGAYLAAAVATFDPDVYVGLPAPKPAAAVLWYGAYSFTERAGLDLTGWGSAPDWKLMPSSRDESPELWKLASPVEHLTPDDGRFLVVHGERDRIVHPSQSVVFVQEAEERGVRARLLLVGNADHGFRALPSLPPPTLSLDDVTSHSISFFQEALRAQNEPAGIESTVRSDVASGETVENTSTEQTKFRRKTTRTSP